MIREKIVNNQIELLVYSTRFSLQRGMRRRGMRNTKKVDGVAPHNRYSCKLIISKESSLLTVVHECVHVATWLMRRNKMLPNLGRKYGEREEVFAYYQGWVLQEVLKHFEPTVVEKFEYNHKEILSSARRSFKKA